MSVPNELRDPGLLWSPEATQVNYSSLIWLLLLQTPALQNQGAGENLSQAHAVMNMVAKFSSLGNFQEFQCNEAFHSCERMRCSVALN